MLINDMDIARVMIHVQYIKEEKIRDRDEFKYKRDKTKGTCPWSKGIM